MIRTFPTELNGLFVGYNADSLVVDYVYPGTIDIHIVDGITLKTTGDAKSVRLGRLLVERTAESVMDDRSWQWEPSAAAKARAWVQHVLVADSLEQSQSYEFEGQLVLVGHRLPPRAAEVSLYAAGFRPSLGTWRAPATDERRSRLLEFVRGLDGDGAASAATPLTAPPDERKERAQHVWMRWHAIFRTTLEVGGRTYQVRGRPTLRDHALEIELRHASSKSELTIRFDVSTHPLLSDVTVELGDHNLRRELLAWEDLPALAEEIDAAIIAQKKGQRTPRMDVNRAEKPAIATTARPRAGAEAAKTVARRLQKLLTGSIRIDRYRYSSADSEAIGDQVVVRFQSSDGPQLVLYVAPRQEREVDLRGELIDENGGVVRRFDWTVIELADLIALSEVSFAQWFGVPVEPEQKLSVIMMEALAALHAEEDARPWEPHSWPGVHDSTKDALVARGLVVALDGKGGGFPRYKTTSAGRAILLKRTAPPGPPRAAQEAAEEAHMGAALRAARDDEEAAWAEALRRGIAFEVAKNGLGHDAARKAAIRNLAADLNHYDLHRDDGPTPTAAGPSAAVDRTMLLRIQRDATPGHPAIDIQKRVSSVEEGSREYRRAVEAGGEGASTFPAGQIVVTNGPTYTISYNGRVWDGDQKIYDPMPARDAEPENAYEVARSAIRALGLPASKYATYLRQAEAAITDGKSYEPVLKRARKAADKLGLGKRREESQASPARAPQSSELATILDTFNDEPRFRLASQRQGAGTQTYVVFREGSSADEALAAIDVVNYDVDGVRWLDLRVPANDQDAILERMDRALWAAADAENAAEDNARSPLQDLSDMMERLVQARGVDLKASRSPKRADGYGAIAEALAELAEPAPMDAMKLEVWLESTGVFIKAAEVVADARGDNIKVPDLMRRLWRELLLAVPVTTISAGPSPVPATADAAASGTLVVPDTALRRVRADGGVQATVLERHIREGRATLREIVVRVRGDATRPKWSIVSDATERLQPGAALHDNTHPDEFLRLLYRNINAFEDHLAEAPKRLADVRTLLYWTAAMLDAPLCQGEVKRRATAALQQAQGYYDAARRQLIEGRTVDAARRIHEALRRISAAAAELAKSCGDGQTLLPGAAPAFEVTPADRAALSLPATAAAPATAQLVRPAAVMMALVKPTPEQLRERFAASSRSEDAKAMPVYYIFRSRSGLPELLTREDIVARAREAVGHEVYDEAERNPMPGAELFESAIGAVELLLDAEFEGRADPRWASSILLNQQKNANTEKQP